MIHVVDYGVGNLGSVLNMIRKIGGQAKSSGDLTELEQAQKILLPGVGSYDAAVQKLQNLGLDRVLRAKAASGTPLLGICLGMQLLAESSEEGVLPGLGLVPGEVKRFRSDPTHPTLKVPHMGWNLARAVKPHPLLEGLNQDSRFYFVHSYYFDCENADDRLLETNYGIPFTSGVQHANVMGVQFHPEKSHRFGMQLMRNFVSL